MTRSGLSRAWCLAGDLGRQGGNKSLQGPVLTGAGPHQLPQGAPMSSYEPAGPNNPARRKALSCLAAWSGAAVVWTVAGGVPRALGATGTGGPMGAGTSTLTFAQISDTHIGFNKAANPDVVGTLRHAIADINALPQKPAFVVHTGDVSHLSKPEEFAKAIVVLGHIPLWTIWEPWGWGTADSAQALALLRPYGSVTVLNGHIHQVLQKVEGTIALHTAMSLAYPLPTPGQSGIGEPGPVTVPAGELGK